MYEEDNGYMRVTRKSVPILMYHSISQNASPRFRQFTVSPRAFAEQMTYLYHQVYTPLTVTQFVKMRARGDAMLPDKPVVITFDDGFADFYSEALPVLHRYNFAATLYVATAFVEGTSRWLEREREAGRPMVTWRQLRDIVTLNIECGAHSHQHLQLDTLALPFVRDEVVRSKVVLEHRLGQQIQSFAYPFGYHTARVRQLVREAGYTSACAVGHALSSPNNDPFSLTRLMIGADLDIEAFAALLVGHSLSLVATISQLYLRTRTPIWQAVRRYAISGKQYIQEGQ